jgi:hypothetical protein
VKNDLAGTLAPAITAAGINEFIFWNRIFFVRNSGLRSLI